MPCPIRSAPRWRSASQIDLRTGRLAGVRHAVQSGGARLREVRGELLPADADLRTAQPEADQTVRSVSQRGVQRDVGGRHAGFARDVEAPAQDHAVVGRGPNAGVLDGLAEGVGAGCRGGWRSTA